MFKSSPIAVIDTGIGGLSVLSALRKIAPNEEIYYFSDTKNLPYGYKSEPLIKLLAKDFIDTAIKVSDCKMLIVACHTISVLAMPKKEDYACLMMDMLKPSILGIKDIIMARKMTKLSMISTKATFDSEVYKKAFLEFDINFNQKPLQYLVHLVEDIDLSLDKISSILQSDLDDDFKNAHGLVLGCTHFSALKDHFKQIMAQDCLIIDPADFVAHDAMELLRKNNLLNESGEQKPLQLFVTDNTDRFSKAAKRFISHEPLNVSLLS